MCVHAHVHVHGYGVHGVQKKTLDSLELEFQGIEFESSAGALQAFNPYILPPQTP